MIFHVLNRGNARDRIFNDDVNDDLFAFYLHGQFHDLTTGTRERTVLCQKTNWRPCKHLSFEATPSSQRHGNEATAKQLALESTFRPRGLAKEISRRMPHFR